MEEWNHHARQRTSLAIFRTSDALAFRQSLVKCWEQVACGFAEVIWIQPDAWFTHEADDLSRLRQLGARIRVVPLQRWADVGSKPILSALLTAMRAMTSEWLFFVEDKHLSSLTSRTIDPILAHMGNGGSRERIPPACYLPLGTDSPMESPSAWPRAAQVLLTELARSGLDDLSKILGLMGAICYDLRMPCVLSSKLREDLENPILWSDIRLSALDLPRN